MRCDFVVYRPPFVLVSLSNKQLCLCIFPNEKECAEKLLNRKPVWLCSCFLDLHFTCGQKRKAKQVASFLFQKR